MDDNYYDYEYQAGNFANIEDYYEEPLYNETFGNVVTIANTYDNCIVPSTKTIFWHMLIMLGWSLSCRVGWFVSLQLRFQADMVRHVISIVTGCALLCVTSGIKSSIIVVALALGTYFGMLLLACFRLASRALGMIVVAFVIALHLTNELLLNQPATWEAIRGPIMIANMKLISLAYDAQSVKEHTNSNLPTVLPFLGYMCAPATLLMGPWIPFTVYAQSVHLSALQRRKSYRWVLWCILCSAIAVIFVNLSNCVAPLLCSDRASIWLRIYRDAFAVRCSHYFVSFLSQSLLAANGIPRCKEKQVKPSAWLGHMVCRPLQVEFPRSLSAVVRQWNIPMHDFLKNYIFLGNYRYFGSYVLAIFITYLVSALLHGYHLKIYLVLLSLAFFAYVEHVLRRKLAFFFDACITANPCQKTCRYKYCTSRGWRSKGALLVMLANFCFGLLCTFQLAYLGVMMSDTDVESFSTTLGFGIWSKLHYQNHWIVFTIFVLQLIL